VLCVLSSMQSILELVNKRKTRVWLAKEIASKDAVTARTICIVYSEEGYESMSRDSVRNTFFALSIKAAEEAVRRTKSKDCASTCSTRRTQLW
jgi:ribosomal protein S3AE